MNHVLKLLRKLRGRMTGKTPCSFEYSHGHEFSVVSVKRYGSGTYAVLSCDVCGKKATVDSFSGLEIDR